MAELLTLLDVTILAVSTLFVLLSIFSILSGKNSKNFKTRLPFYTLLLFLVFKALDILSQGKSSLKVFANILFLAGMIGLWLLIKNNGELWTRKT
ncbi:MAG TPA: hypothetical protein VFE88_00520 [Candidatus Nanoarchaeia archaeon]|nr:hypothetical protein [Candidatus Nanoarchaeia archaeon]